MRRVSDTTMTEALMEIAHAINRVAKNMEMCRSDHPLMRSTLDEVYTGLSEIADALRDKGSSDAG
jgi:hypothetical protein